MKQPCLALIAVLLTGLAGLAGCASDTPDFEDVAPADELYAEGLEILEGWRLLWLFPFVNHTKAIEIKFQHLPAVATAKKKERNREFLVVGWDPEASLFHELNLDVSRSVQEAVS